MKSYIRHIYAMFLRAVAIRLRERGQRKEALELAWKAAQIHAELSNENAKAFWQQYANSLSTLSITLSQLGRHMESLAPAQEVCGIYKKLSEQNPKAFRQSYAMSLNNLVLTLRDLGEREKALKPAQDVCGIYKELSERNPKAFKPDYAMSLNNLALTLRGLGRREEAMELQQVACGIRKELSEQNPKAFRRSYAMSLNNLALTLRDVGGREKALKPAQDACAIYKELSERNPKAFKPDYAMSLNNLSVMLRDVGEREKALESAQEACGICKKLSKQNPEDFRHNYAMSLNTLAVTLRDLGRREDALEPVQEACAIRKELAEQNPGAFRPDYAMSLSTHAIILSNLGQREKALEPAQEACGIYKELSKQNPKAFRNEYAMSLTNLAIMLRDLREHEKALEPAQVAYDIYEELSRQNPKAFRQNHAGSLNNLSITLRDLGQHKEALELAQEACGIRKELSEQYPDAFRHEHAASLTNLSIMLHELGRREEALEPAKEARDIYEELAEENPNTFRHEYANSLNTLSSTLHDLGRHTEALKPAREACGIRKELAAQNPEAFRNEYGMSLHTLVVLLGDLGRREEALEPAQAVCGINKKLAEQNPKAFKPNYAGSLNTLSITLHHLGRHTEALEPAQEACCIRKELSEQNPKAFRHEYANSLDTLSTILENFHARREEALKNLREAAKLVEECRPQLAYGVVKLGLRIWSHLGTLLREGESDNAPDYREAAAAFRKAREWVETFQGALQDMEQRRRVREELISLFDLGIRNAMDWLDTSNDAAERAAALTDALSSVEASRSRMLAQRVADEELAPRNTPSELIEQFRDARRKLRVLQEQWKRASGWDDEGAPGGSMRPMRLGAAGIPTDQGYDDAKKQSVQLEKEREEKRQRAVEQARESFANQFEAARRSIADLVAKIRKFDPEYEFGGVPPAASLEDIRAALPENAAAVSLVLLQEGSVALIVTRGTLEAVRLPKFDFQIALAWGRKWLESYFDRPPRPARAPDESAEEWEQRQQQWETAAQEHLEQWHAQIAARLGPLEEPVVASLAEALDRLDQPHGAIQRLILCPSFTLHLAPLHACRIPVTGQRLGDRWVVSYTPSLSMLARFSKRERELSEPALLVTNPTGDLAFTEVEAAALASHYPGARQLHREVATREAVLKYASDAGVFVYSGHMQFHPEEPLRGTAAILARVSDETAEASASASTSKESAAVGSYNVRDARGRFVPPPHWLTLADIFTQLNLTRCRLAVNNGCESALRPFFYKLEKRAVEEASAAKGGGEKSQTALDVTDDAESLVTGFLFAGAPAVIGTLWAVWDISAALLMNRFHSLWRGGKGLCPGDALHAAVKWLRGDEDVNDGIHTGRKLVADVLPVFLQHVQDAKVRKDCEKMALAHYVRSPDAPPFGDPSHWAAFTANGAAFQQSA